jgi:hypothetical protein
MLFIDRSINGSGERLIVDFRRKEKREKLKTGSIAKVPWQNDYPVGGTPQFIVIVLVVATCSPTLTTICSGKDETPSAILVAWCKNSSIHLPKLPQLME